MLCRCCPGSAGRPVISPGKTSPDSALRYQQSIADEVPLIDIGRSNEMRPKPYAGIRKLGQDIQTLRETRLLMFVDNLYWHLINDQCHLAGGIII